MRYPDSFLDEIRERLPVSEVVRRRIPLKKAGREWRGLSPFNKEKTPSFFVNDQKGFYHDFSSGKSGDQFKFVMETEGLTFPEAVERLAQLAGLPLPKQDKETERIEHRRKSLHEIMDLASRFFEAQLSSKSGAHAKEYTIGRGLRPETLREFRIGYAPAGRFALKEHLGAQGISIEDMIEVGLLIAGDDIPVPYDRFRDRLMIPIHDSRGRIIAFGGRALSADAQAKYLNSPETTLFHKRSTVFNFHRARGPAHDDGTVVVVEGYMDAIAVYQAGLKSVVATMGTAFTEEQINSLWRLSPEPIVCFDADRAGIAAAHKSIDRMLPLLSVGHTFRFALMIGGKDPDDLIREKGLDAFRFVLRGSLPLWDVLWERETGGFDFRSPDAQASLEQKILSIVRTIKDAAVQSAYTRTARLQLVDLFWRHTKGKAKAKDFAKGGLLKSEVRIEKEGRRHGIQKLVLGLLVEYPDMLDTKAEKVASVHFEERLEAFRKALYNLLILQNEISVQFIYGQLGEDFYEVLDEVHGEKTDKLRRGHKLYFRFPIITVDPPHDFVARCIDHFCLILQTDQLGEYINSLKKAAATAIDDTLVEMKIAEKKLDHLQQHERMMSDDMALAEEALAIRRAAFGPTPKFEGAVRAHRRHGSEGL
jgi:DNA primase